MTRARRPLGQPTRGKTAPNRLRKTDAFLALAFPGFVGDLPGLYVDVGFGEAPITSRETLRRLRRLHPALSVLGVEIDPARVTAAQRYAEPGLGFRLGGFDLPLRAGERAAVVRAFNVLRQYGETAVAGALAALAASLVPGGLLLEGTSDPSGRLLAFNLHRRAADGAGLERLGLVLAPTLRPDFRPRQLRPVLPKSHVHHAEPRGDVDRFFAAWDVAWRSARRRASDPRSVFAESARWLAAREGYAVDRRPGLLRRGFLWLGPTWPERVPATSARAAAGPAEPPPHVDTSRPLW